jgi:SAM-dependent methyltransferase
LAQEGYGIEADVRVKKVADYYGLNIQIGPLEECDFGGAKFDLVSLNQVIEHIPDPGRLLMKLRDSVRREGVVVLSFPNVGSLYRRLFGRRWINWHVPYHIYHFSRESFTRLCERGGWTVMKYKTVTPNLWTVLQIRSLFTPIHMGSPSPLWSLVNADSNGGTQLDTVAKGKPPKVASLRRHARQMVIWGSLAAIAVVNRLIDFFGLGDSAVFFVRIADNTRPQRA